MTDKYHHFQVVTLIRSKTLPTNDFELTVPDLYNGCLWENVLKSSQNVMWKGRLKVVFFHRRHSRVVAELMAYFHCRRRIWTRIPTQIPVLCRFFSTGSDSDSEPLTEI